LREGPHLLQIAAEGFQPLERDEVAAGTTDLVVALSPRGRAGVTVRDGSGTVLRRYRLAIRQWFEQNGGQIGMVRDVPDRVVHLDQDTSVAYVDGLDDGQFVFQVEAEGFASTLSPVLQLDATAREAIVEMSLARGGQFTGTVVDEAGRPVSGATVRTQPQGASEDNPVFRMLQSLVPDRITRKEAVTGGDGSFVLPGLSHANYQLEVVHGEFCRTVRRDLSLHEDRTETVPPIRLIRGALLRGRAVADGKPVPQAQIVLTPFAEPSPTDPSVPSAAGKSPDETSVARVEAVTNLDGSFELPRRVPAGTYELRGVSMVGQDPTADAFQKLVQMKRSTVRVEVRPGQLVVEQDLDLSR
ncbi:MAG: carboxypeptidase regulatory-like domain-containing protein, partial [Planctomycetota bacterium]